MEEPLKKILVIDDEAVFREAITNALTHCNYLCIAEKNPSDGIMRLKKEPFDLVLLDIMMDPIDGWDTLALIRSIAGGKEIPIIMSSAKKLQTEEIIRYGELVAGFITKPFVDDEFCEAVSDFFSWYEPLISNVKAAAMQGVPPETCTTWLRLYRQITAMNQLIEVASPRCIPDDSSTEEECQEKRMRQIRTMVADKRKERDELRILYPVFTL